ncbi:MAG: tetratricopeptide repeat protein, partial [Lachnospiraceae bacterium]|nr:tetratricopeptide repeat protein [Lachnospiraceae bacterium]
MRCMNCGAELTDSAYCPKCGCDVSVQKQAIVLSGLYYNQGLEKAQVRDLSGAIDQLKRSLKFNKLNVPARNLLGLVYFETGEVVSALSEWVISKNIQPEDNIAAEYIRNLQQDANRLDIINQTIKKYNIALENCLEGNEDVSLIQLKKILAQNPKLIKGYHLLALLYIHKREYEKARRLLKKAIRIDKTNTTTLRFLREVDEQTGTATSLESHFSLWGGRRNAEEAPQEEPERAPGTSALYHSGSGGRGFPFLNVLMGAVIGAAAIWFLFIPAYTRSINRAANEKITKYSSDMAVYSAQIQTMNDQIRASQDTVNTAKDKIDAANAKSVSYDNLIKAQNAYNNGSYDAAATSIADIDGSKLSVEAKAVYDSLSVQLANFLLAAYKKNGLE